MVKRTLILSSVFVVAILVWWWYPHGKVDFNSQVKPIINKNCIACHGGVRRKAGFSLFRQDALAPTESGKPAIIPGDPDGSEMIRRITLNDPEERMPYKHDPLKTQEIELLRQWIQEGANWGDHWAYVPVRRPEVPNVFAAEDWIKTDIDPFIVAKWKEHGLTLSPEADKATLLRRVSLDLTGLPPDEHLARQFLSDENPDAYAKLVDELLASPRYGEHWAAMWLDLARYADTKGYERDYARNIWRYRDWLIRSFNDDLPYDRFITEQLAGDLLPYPTDDQLIATAFHRNTMTNDEGGTQNEEFRTAAVLDRVNTTWEALLGTTFACTQCHSHPYDPFRHDEYYKFLAFFNNSRDEDTEADYPVLRTFKPEDSVRLARLSNWLSTHVSAEKSREVTRFIKTWQPSYNSLTADHFTNSELADSKWLVLRNHGISRLPRVDGTDKDRLLFRFTSWTGAGVCKIHLDDPAGAVVGEIHHRNSEGKWAYDQCAIKPFDGVHDLFFTYENAALKKQGDNGILFDWLSFTDDFPGKGKQGYDSARKDYWTLVTAEAEKTPIMTENPSYMRRTSYVFERGNWLVKGAEVTPATPHSLLPFPADAPANRLGLAAWITNPDHPLTSRTMVNRLWGQLFGRGLAETLEDLGTQGIPPTHPELLDYLAWQFSHDYHWSIKALLKQIVLSATYRQDSRMRKSDEQKDPGNRYYARGPRVRLSAEQVHDQALFVSGILSKKMMGPSVMPFQPKGIWSSPYNDLSWKMSKGEDGYRRAIYTYWKRTSAYPSMLLFDGVSREVCYARRIRTNTPLQALTTLNDSVYVVAAYHLAGRMRSEADVTHAIQKGYELAIGKPITDAKLKVLTDLYSTTSKFRKAKARNGRDHDPALELVASAILNLDEFIMKN